MTVSPPKNSPRRRRRLAAGLTGLALLAVPVAISGAVGSWSNAGGDAGQSGYQAVAKGSVPIGFVPGGHTAYDLNSDSALRTGATITAAANPSEQRVAFGKYFTDGSTADRNELVIRALDDPTSPLQTVTNLNTVGTDADPDGFGPAPGGVNPVSSSSGSTPGVLFAVHNDDNSPSETAAGLPTPSTSSGNDIALASFNEATGARINDFAVGKATGGPSPAPTNPQATDGYTIEASPVISPPAADGSGDRVILFVAKGVGAAVPRIFMVPVDAAGSPATANTRTDDVVFKDVPGLNTKVPPTIAYLEDPSRPPGTEVPYVLVSVTAGAGASDLRAFKVADFADGPTVASDIDGTPAAISVPVSENGLPPGQPNSEAAKATSIYAAYDEGTSTVVRRFVQNGTSLVLDETAASPSLTGKPSPGMSVAAEVVEGVQEAGRIVVSTAANVFILDAATLDVVDKFQDDGEPEFGTDLGFTKTAPTVSGDLIYIVRDDGAQLVLDLDNGENVPNDPTGFEENLDNNTSKLSLSRPAVANGYIAFLSDLGIWIYRGALNPVVSIQTPAPGAQVSGGAVPLQAKVTDPDGTVAQVTFRVDGTVIATLDQPDPTTTGTYSTTFNSNSVLDGAHTLTVSATDDVGQVGTDIHTFVVNNFADPTADLKVTPASAQPTGTPVTLDASGSTGTTGENESITKYRFDLDQNGTFELDKGAVPTAEVKFTTPGSRQVKVQITDSHGDTAVATATVTALNRAPIPAFTGPALVKPGATATFDGSGSSDPDGSITLFEWDLDGNGTFETNTGKTPTVSKQFPNAGTVKIQLRVLDDNNKSESIARDIVVGNQDPVALFIAIPTAANTDERVSFDASGSKDSDGGIVKYEWDLDGNGTFEVNGGNNPRTSRVYATAGVVNVKLRVTDTDGAAAEIVRQITIIQRPIPRVSARGLSLALTPKADKKAPFAFTAKGALTRPTTMTAAAGCIGTVTITVKVGNRTIASRRATLTKSCRYSAKISFKNAKKFGKAKALRVQARFGGNARLKSRTSAAKSARVK